MDNDTQAPLPAQHSEQVPMSSSSTPQTKGSSNTLLFLGVFIVAVVLLTGVVIYRSSANKLLPVENSNHQNENTNSMKPNDTTSTDIQLEKDGQSIDTNLNALSADMNNVDQGLNDQPVDLSQ